MRNLNLTPKFILVALAFICVLGACSDDVEIDPAVVEINRFVSQNMKDLYLWNTEMPALNPKTQPDTKAFFDELLYKKIDRWSFITDDVDELDNYFAGIRKELGYSLRGYYLKEGSDQVVAYVEYVEPGGPADRAGVKRGDLIIKVQDEDITPDNYSTLFFADKLTIGLGLITDSGLRDSPTSITFNSEVLQVNPILSHNVFNVEGKLIAYLAFTGFIDDFDDELQAVFAHFKAERVTDLILDLRYNGGGAVSTARLLASMICPASCAGKLFLRSAYNEGLEAAIKTELPDTYTDFFEDYFEDNVNNLDLSNLYVLTTQGTASASEMVIYSLSPYMNVVQIGEQTHGKYYGSTTIKDENKKHTWAIQPIIMRAENTDNSIDYGQGLIPDIKVNDDYTYPLGTTDDYLTAIAIQEITGAPMPTVQLKSGRMEYLKPASNLQFEEHPLKYEMHFNQK
ncbi:PDZ domain (Also known as DHR or GLGF) [Saccharicrinis carchari]|uniref:PDZ domain (Also known as DHR or GLGF) n=1 Tax=Saccharicrinis carchari TaxID=1168039 RepID=A0A521DN29_SACCC|nr:S41 family peptidase [Saccharicrinis carchari]SMO73139.1 PDZ domain (Also known as DHR or GLGF) [Saccharicrinis carchari]